MIQPLRRVHERMFLALAIVLPILFVAGVRSRQISKSNMPVAAHTPLATAQHTLLINGTRVAARFFRDGSGTTVEFNFSADLLVPDVLVYASASESKRDVPADAVLLGAFVSRETYRLPSENSRFVLLYSLARRELLGTFPAGDER
jgi:hypothetical protein